MTLAPHRSPKLRFALALVVVVVCVAFGVLTLRTFGVGPSLFLFALGAVALVDAVVVSRNRTDRHTGVE